MGKQAARRRHVPQRTCVGCRQTAGKRQLIRLVRTPQGVVVDPSGKLAGRGAYVHDDESCWHAAFGGALSKALKTAIGEANRDQLLQTLAAVSTSHQRS